MHCETTKRKRFLFVLLVLIGIAIDFLYDAENTEWSNCGGTSVESNVSYFDLDYVRCF